MIQKIREENLMSMIANDWLPAVSAEFKKPYYRELYQFVSEEYGKAVVYQIGRAHV